MACCSSNTHKAAKAAPERIGGGDERIELLQGGLEAAAHSIFLKLAVRPVPRMTSEGAVPTAIFEQGARSTSASLEEGITLQAASYLSRTMCALEPSRFCPALGEKMPFTVALVLVRLTELIFDEKAASALNDKMAQVLLDMLVRGFKAYTKNCVFTLLLLNAIGPSAASYHEGMLATSLGIFHKVKGLAKKLGPQQSKWKTNGEDIDLNYSRWVASHELTLSDVFFLTPSPEMPAPLPHPAHQTESLDDANISTPAASGQAAALEQSGGAIGVLAASSDVPTATELERSERPILETPRAADRPQRCGTRAAPRSRPKN